MFYYFLFSVALTVLFIILVSSKYAFSMKKSKREKETLWQKIKRLPWKVIKPILIVFFGSWGINYFQMPTLALWGFEGVWIEAFAVSLAGFIVGTSAAKVWSDDHLSYNENKERKTRRQAIKFFSIAGIKEYQLYRAIPLVITLVAAIVAAVQSWEIFHDSKFAQRLPVVETIENLDSADVQATDTAFNKTIAVVDVKKMIVADGEVAKKVGGDELGNQTGLASKVEPGNFTLQNLNGSFTINGGKRLSFNDDLYWVAPLEHIDIFKWLNNKTTPGYILIDATNINNRHLVTEVNGHPLKLKYLESAFCSEDIERHIKSNGYLSKGLNDHCFEIDSMGNPYWVLSYYKQTIGFAGEESVGPITVNAETGEVKAYSIKDAPSWIDRIQPASFIAEQVEQWGSLQKGWWNSCWWSKQEEVMEPTPGMTLVYSQGQSYWYTGIKSVASDEGTNGFMLINTRTKEAKFYKSPGFNELAAMKIAEGQQYAKSANYNATYPVLYNVRGVPTYFMTYKDNGGNIQGYCFISSNSRDAVGCDKSKKEAARKYEEALKSLNKDKLIDSDVENETLLGTIRDIRLVGETYYILVNEKRGFEFTGTNTNFPELTWSKIGDHVKMNFKIGEDQRVPLDSFDDLNFEF